jgi:hypothetical protein
MFQDTTSELFIGSGSKPKEFKINKGKVRVIASVEEFWIKFLTKDTEFLDFKQEGEVLEVNISKDSVDITINIFGLDRCNIFLDAGIMDVSSVSYDSVMSIKSGTMSVHVDKDEVGVISAHVGTGVLSNKSGLKQLNIEYKNAFLPYYVGQIVGIELAGDLEGATSKLNVDTGVLDLI